MVIESIRMSADLIGEPHQVFARHHRLPPRQTRHQSLTHHHQKDNTHSPKGSRFVQKNYTLVYLQ